MKRFFISVLMLICAIGFVYSDSGEVSINKIIVEENEKNVTGVNTIKAFLKIQDGDVFASEQDLNAALDREAQALINTRYFKSVEVTAESSDSLGAYIVYVKYADGWTLLPIPYPIPDSGIGNNGWSFGIEITYDNFLGTMSDFYFDGYANIAFGEIEKLKEWKVGPRWKNIRLGDLNLSFEYIQRYKTTEVSDPNRAAAEQLLQHYTNHESFLKIGTQFDLGSHWSYAVNPKLGFKYNFDYHSNFEGSETQGNDEVIEDRLNVVIGHDIGIENVNWVGVLREGYALKLSNNLRFLNSYDNTTAAEAFRFVTDFELNGRYYAAIGTHFNYYTRARALGIINGYNTGLGGKLRGVKNSSMYGDLGVFWQNTLGIEIFGIESFHLQLHPFLDLGAAFYTKDLKPIKDVFRIGFGSEIVLIFGSMEMPVTIGYDPISDFVDFTFTTGFSY